jgi:hypothetical protein
MSTEPDRHRSRPASAAAARGFVLLLGLAGMAWAYSVLPTFAALVPLQQMADRVLSDDYFKPGALKQIVSSLETPPRAIVASAGIIRASAILRLSAAEEALTSGDVAGIDARQQAAEDAVKAALARSPSDPFLWMMLFSLANARGGFDPGNARLLAQSYAVGPLEGWVARRRNRIALAAFPMLAPALQARIVAEFAALVQSEFIEDAALNLAGVGWASRDALLAGLAQVDILPRESLAKRLRNEGVKESVPGVELDERLWR